VSPSQWKLPGSWAHSAPDSLVAKSDQAFTPIPLRVESTVSVDAPVEAPVASSSEPVSASASVAALPTSITEGLTTTLTALTAELEEVNRMLESGGNAAKTAIATHLIILNKTLEQSEPSNEGSTTIIPALPTSFETRNAGTTFTFLPRILSDDRIDIEFELEHVRFLGFFDYGPTIQSGIGTPIATKIQ
jgi:hypothetical protein